MDPEMIHALFLPEDQCRHTKAIEYLQQMRENKDAWKACAETLSSGGTVLEDKVKFVCLQILENYAKTNYNTATVDEQAYLRQHVSQWLNCICTQRDPEKVFIRNKSAQLVSLIFIVDYVSRWPTLMPYLLSLLQFGPNAADLYLKILLAVDTEVVDRHVIHSQAEMERNTIIKDRMREQCVVDMTNSWYDILVKYEMSHPEIVCHCHDVIGAFISWIDINLIANDRFVNVLVKHLQEPLLRETAADCIYEIITKGMEPLNKIQLVESLYNILDQAGILKPDEEDDSDFIVRLARLLNGIGVQLILCWQKFKVRDENKELTYAAIENKVTLLLSYIASEYDDVSASLLEFVREYIQMVKQKGKFTNVELGHFENIIYVMIAKSKYDKCYNFDHYGEDEAMFDEYRKKLKTVFHNLAAVAPELVLKVCKDYVVTTLNRWQGSPYEDVEAAICLLYNLGEALPASHGNHFVGAVQQPSPTPFSGSPSSLSSSSVLQVKTSLMQEMMHLLITSGVSAHSHPTVALQFFECVTRYEKFFSCEPQLMPEVLKAFVDLRGMRNPSVKVRSRTSYLFSRFVRCLKGQMSSYTEEILSQLTDLLVIATPGDGHVHLLSTDDQLYVFEAAALLIVSSSSIHQRKEQLMCELLTPVLTKVAFLAEQLTKEQDIAQQAIIAMCICHATAVTARTSKAFSTHMTMQILGCVPLYLDALQLFINCLNVDKEREVIGSGVRQFMHRLVVCLDSTELMQFLPPVSQALLRTPATNALTEYLPLINQIITKYKKEILDFLQSIFVPLVWAIFAVLSESLEDNEEEERRLQKTLQRSYYLFLTTIVSTGLSDVLRNLEPQTLHQVLISVIQGAVEFPDPVAQKNCFIILRRLVEEWGLEEVLMPHFIEFLYSQIVPACFHCPLKTTFDLNDAQSILALQESAMCLRLVYEKRGEEFLQFLRSEYLPKMELSSGLIDEYCRALVSDAKFFRNYSKVFFQRAKS